jgi:hypothetical protein
MRVIRAQIQTVEEIYDLVWSAGQTGSRSKPRIKAGADCSARISWAGIGPDNFAYSVTNTAAKAGVAFRPEGSPSNWRCVELEKLSRVKLLQDTWRTGPNHLRPASCVAEADIDAEDHPEREPQKGH